MIHSRNLNIVLVAGLMALAVVYAAPESGIPGAQSANAILATSMDGMSRYLAPDGPIQPAIAAIGTLPVRGAETLNNGISRISSGLNGGAQSAASRAGSNLNNIRMPGMQTLESSMPASVAQLGNMMQGAIRSKNSFIMNQAQRGIEAGDRLRSSMAQGLQGFQARSSSMPSAGDMMNEIHQTMKQSGQKLQGQLQRSLSESASRLQSMQGMGSEIRNQAQGISRTVSSGLQGAAQQLHRTGEQVQQQLTSNMQQNHGKMQGMMGSMQNSMGKMGQDLQSNLQGVVRHAQNAAQQVSSRLQQAASGPMNMLQNLGSSLGNMMKGGSGGSMSGGRY